MAEKTNDGGFDRGAFNALSFCRCVRGFTLTVNEAASNYLVPPTFAFDRIEDLAAWLVEQYGESDG
jgi:hypothetical protein